MRRSGLLLIAVVSTFVLLGSGIAQARPFGIKNFRCSSGGLQIMCTVETTEGATAPLQVRWVVDGVERPAADDNTMLLICCIERRTPYPVKVTVTDADGFVAAASDIVYCRKVYQ